MNKMKSILVLFIVGSIFSKTVEYEYDNLNTNISIPKPSISHNVTATYYNPVKSQCDGNPLVTADGSKINLKKLKNKEIRWIAVSRDLLKYYNYGDTVDIQSENSKLRGKWVVKDCMNKRFRKKIDFLSYEKDFMSKPETVKIRK